jgi:hypothetical protein
MSDITFGYNEFVQATDYNDETVSCLSEGDLEDRCWVVRAVINGGALDYPYGTIYQYADRDLYAAIVYLSDNAMDRYVFYGPLLMTMNFTIKLWINARFLAAIAKMKEEIIPPGRMLPVLINTLQHSLDAPIDLDPDVEEEVDISAFIVAFRGDNDDDDLGHILSGDLE